MAHVVFGHAAEKASSNRMLELLSVPMFPISLLIVLAPQDWD